jgi:hypothetical protein
MRALTRELTRTLKSLALPEVTGRRCPAGRLPGPLSYRGGRQTLPARTIGPSIARLPARNVAWKQT